jgi:hypothetical protein
MLASMKSKAAATKASAAVSLAAAKVSVHAKVEKEAKATVIQTTNVLHLSLQTLALTMRTKKIVGEASVGVSCAGLGLVMKQDIDLVGDEALEEAKAALNPSDAKLSEAYKLIRVACRKCLQSLVLSSRRLRELGYSDDDNVTAQFEFGVFGLIGVETAVETTVGKVLQHHAEVEEGEEQLVV